VSTSRVSSDTRTHDLSGDGAETALGRVWCVTVLWGRSAWQ